MAILRGPLSAEGFKGHFSGHETFPVRYGWLKKVFDAISGKSALPANEVFNPDVAMAHFGVGKNMVASMKHWAFVAGIIEASDDQGFRPTKFGEVIFCDDGLDPFLEEMGTIWLLHWKIATNASRATTWFWAFNHFALGFLDRETLIREISLFCETLESRRVKIATIKRDIDCFFQTYSPVQDRRRKASEATIECPLSELDLIVPTNIKGTFEFRRGAQESLPNWVLNFAIADFWSQRAESETISIEMLAFEPGSPGQIFKLDEASMSARLSHIDDSPCNYFSWSETAGMSQLIRAKRDLDPIEILQAEYRRRNSKVAA